MGLEAGERGDRGALHLCARGGALVGPVGFVPESPLDYNWSPDLHGLGCSHIVCRSCGGDVSAARSPLPAARAYRCACQSFAATRTHWLGASEARSTDGAPPPRQWHCGGHPARRLPLALDGIAVGAPGGWRQLLIETTDGRLRPRTPAWLPGYPHAWLERLVATVDASERGRFAELVAALRDAPETPWRRMAFDIANALRLDVASSGASARPNAVSDAGGAGLCARWLLIDAPPGSGTDRCDARIGFESTAGGVKVLGDVMFGPCADLASALSAARAVMRELGLRIGPPFSLVYPRYPATGSLEAEMHRIAWAIKDAADASGWGFERDIPDAVAHHPPAGSDRAPASTPPATDEP